MVKFDKESGFLESKKEVQNGLYPPPARQNAILFAE